MAQESLRLPALALLLLSPMIGELLSGSAPPVEFYQPFAFAILVVLYGGGAILVREFAHRWQKGWPPVLLLGAAYGIIEEGLMVKSFFDPNWMDLGLLGSYGRWAGVNWVWSLGLTAYHAFFSIAIPILLVGVLFPRCRARPWVSRRTLYVLGALFVADGVLIFMVLTPYRPPALAYLVALLLVLALVALAQVLPHPLLRPGSGRPRGPFVYVLAGFFATVGFFLLLWAVPHTGIHPLVTMALMVGLVAGVLWLLCRMSGNGVAWSAKHQLGLASGMLGFFILLAPLTEADRNSPDDKTGMALVGLQFVVFLLYAALRARRHEGEMAAAG
ncbi:MAG: hypothetical protein ACYTFZ_08920 [Planctomycetota bacterium]|jgi:hypothetical protein